MSAASVRVPEPSLDVFVPGRLWIAEYPVRYAGMDLRSRMTVVRLDDGSLMIHSPGPIDEGMRREIEALGRVGYIVAPGTFHYYHLEACQTLFPRAETHVCPGLERKRPELEWDAILGDEPPRGWAGQIEQAVVSARLIAEVVFFDRPSRTLIVTDLVENIGDLTPGVPRMLRFWWALFRMWNRPKPAPEYQVAWGDRRRVGAALQRVVAWDFDRLLLTHGDLIERGAKAVVRDAWARPLGFAR